MTRKTGTPDAIKLPNVMKFKDVQTALGVSRAKIDRLLADEESGFPKAFKIGSERFFLTDQIRDWIMTRAAGGTHQGAPETRAA